MKKLAYFAKGLWADRHLSQWITTIMIMAHVGLGSIILATGVIRFTSPTYDPLVNFTQGNVWVWGVWITLSGILMSVPFRWPNMAGLWLGMFWHIIWMWCFTIAVVESPKAAATPIPMYGAAALICIALLTARIIERNER
jgi:hypothetical protein